MMNREQLFFGQQNNLCFFWKAKMVANVKPSMDEVEKLRKWRGAGLKKGLTYLSGVDNNGTEGRKYTHGRNDGDKNA
jgi:hypothetical protein